MNRNVIGVFFLLNAIFLLLQCKGNPVNQNNNDHPIKAIGSYQLEHVDKDMWGDFQLVLELNNSKYSYGESILIKLYFRNIGNRTITLDGILPYRNSANPPCISIWSDQNKKFEINEIKSNLLNDNKIVINPNKNIMLMEFDLTQIDGFILLEDTSGVGYVAHRLENVYSEFDKGSYKVNADFGPQPQIYFSSTDTLTFSIN